MRADAAAAAHETPGAPIGMARAAGGPAADPRGAQHLHPFGKTDGLRPDQVDRLRGRRPGDRASCRVHDVTHVNRLDQLLARIQHRNQGQGRQTQEKRGTRAAASVDERWPEHDAAEVEMSQRVVGCQFASVISRRRGGVGAQCRQLDDAVNAGLLARREQGCRRVRVQYVEALGGCLGDDAGGVDHRLDPIEMAKPIRR